MKAGLATLALQALAGGLSVRHYSQFPVVPAREGGPWTPAAPLLSVIVPARDEERCLGRLLRSLAEQDYPHLEVIVVDDRSADRTAVIAEGVAGVRVVRGVEPPRGWAGKPHACAQGAAVARGDWLLFVDADTAYATGALSSAVAYAEAQRLGFLSLFLRQECRSFWERLLLPYAYAQYFAGVDARGVATTGHRQALANGQFMLFRRDAYEAVGGHSAVRGSIIDDVEMAVALKRAGVSLTVARGERLGSVHMYPGLAALWHGFVKNAFSFVRANPRGAPSVIGGSLAVGSSLPLLLRSLGTARRARGRRRAAALFVGLAGYALPAALLSPWYARFGARRAYSLAHPLTFAVFQALALTSAWRTLTRRAVTWKGRSYGGTPRLPYYRLPRRQVLELGVALATNRRRLLADDGTRLVASLARPPRVEGAEQIPGDGPFCLAANHYQRWGLWIGWEGAILAAEVAARRPRAGDLHLLVIGGSRLGPIRGRWITVPGTRWMYGRVARVWGMVPMPTGAADTAGRARAIRHLLAHVGAGGAGEAIGLFPEGEKGGVDGLRPALPGVGSLFRLLGRRGIPVLPAAMFEDEDGLIVRFGAPFVPAGTQDAGADEAAATRVMREIAALLPARLQGAYAPATTPARPHVDSP